jgi:hypothetical protein
MGTQVAGNGQNRWVVLLNRSPKGPLTEEEVKTLLSQGMLRQNDIAYQVAAEGEDKGKSEWKLLWQFPEFNRRQPEPNKPKPPVNRSISDRRQKTPPEEIKKKALAELPPDLMEITPEDLLPRSTHVSFKPEPENIAPTDDVALLEDKPEVAPQRFDVRWFYATGAIALLVAVMIKLPGLVRSWHRAAMPATEEDHARNEPIDALRPSGPETGRSPADALAPRVPRPGSLRPRVGNSRLMRPTPPPPPDERDRASAPPPESPAEPESNLDTARGGEEERRDEESAESRPAEEAAPTEAAPRRKTFRRRAASNPSTEEEGPGVGDGDAAGVREDSGGGNPEDQGENGNN